VRYRGNLEISTAVVMAENSGGNGGLYFIVGALAVVVAVFVMVTGDDSFWGGHQLDVHIETPHTPGH